MGFDISNKINFLICVLIDYGKTSAHCGGFFYFCYMASRQNYLTKKFKGRYIERLQEFLYGLDSSWYWNMSLLVSHLNMDVAFCKIYCNETGNLLLVRCKAVPKRVSEYETYMRFLVDKVVDLHREIEPTAEELPKIFMDCKLI